MLAKTDRYVAYMFRNVMEYEIPLKYQTVPGAVVQFRDLRGNTCFWKCVSMEKKRLETAARQGCADAPGNVAAPEGAHVKSQVAQIHDLIDSGLAGKPLVEEIREIKKRRIKRRLVSAVKPETRSARV